MLGWIALGIVISATPVAAKSSHPAAQPPAEGSRPQKDSDKPEKKARSSTATQESLRPPIGPQTTQGLAEDAISRGGR